MPRHVVDTRSGTTARGSRRLHDSRARRRRRSIAGVVLLVLGLGVVGFALVAASTPQPAAVQVDPDGSTTIPRTHFFQNGWVLYAAVEDPRRVPAARELGCSTRGFTPEPQPRDMTRYGSRVVDDVSISAVLLLGPSGPEAVVDCRGASAAAPLVLAASSEAPAFTPTAIAIVGVLVVVLGALVHPVTVELPSRLRGPRPGDDLV